MFLSSPIFKESSLSRYAGKSLLPKKYFFQEHIPLASKNKLAQSKNRAEGNSCTAELQSLFACLKKWEFDDLQCKTQHSGYMRCVEENAKRIAEFNEASKKGTLGQDNKSLTIAQINRLMELYPQPDIGKAPYRQMKRLPTQSYADDLFGRKNIPGKPS
uniref:CHCH domain-containing protein n=1 Tax=Parastrongyloides trichosuri TaxID=131310 RepID=A0A0N4ZS58_PARTI